MRVKNELDDFVLLINKKSDSRARNDFKEAFVVWLRCGWVLLYFLLRVAFAFRLSAESGTRVQIERVPLQTNGVMFANSITPIRFAGGRRGQ